jgi:hypothetical protein
VAASLAGQSQALVTGSLRADELQNEPPEDMMTVWPSPAGSSSAPLDVSALQKSTNVQRKEPRSASSAPAQPVHDLVDDEVSRQIGADEQELRQLGEEVQHLAASEPPRTQKQMLVRHAEDDDVVEEAQAATASTAGVDPIAVRPGAGAGVPDVVEFGMFGKSFYGANLRHNKFTLDFVMKLKWHDPRVVGLVPPGLTEIAMSGKAAALKVWMPEVAVTNRDIKKFDIIATTVIIATDGTVTKVERTTVVCNNIYQLKLYPFDTQTFSVKIASSKYMADEVVLKPEEGSKVSGVRDGLMKGFPYDLEDWKVYAFEEQDGALKKSRGVLAITAK